MPIIILSFAHFALHVKIQFPNHPKRVSLDYYQIEEAIMSSAEVIVGNEDAEAGMTCKRAGQSKIWSAFLLNFHGRDIIHLEVAYMGFRCFMFFLQELSVQILSRKLGLLLAPGNFSTPVGFATASPTFSGYLPFSDMNKR
jgi:hypothetical protein